MTRRIAMASADLEDPDVQSVLEVLRSGRLALGPRLQEFEELIAAYVGAGHGVAVSSGTAALHLAVKCLGIGPGDEVLVPSFTFAASVNALLYERACPVFVDIEPESFNLDPLDLEPRIGPRTRAIMAVDVFGQPAEWQAIRAIADRHGLQVIDDACEALGAEYRGRRLGTFGDATTFAFYPNKQITTGEGGVLVTDDRKFADLARSLRNHGRSSFGPYPLHEHLGYNYRLNEMSAALGSSQLRRIEEILRKRERVARMYTERLKDVEGVRPPVVSSHAKVSWFVYVVTLPEGTDRERVVRDLASAGIPSRMYFSPVHLQPYMAQYLDGRSVRLPVTESYARRTLALPFHNNLGEEEIARVIDALRQSLSIRTGAES